MNIENLIKQYEYIQDILDDIYKDCKAGYYIITKIDGKNNNKYQEGYTFKGYSRGLKEGYSLLLENSMKWFRTSIVQSIDWETEISGTFKTLNSTYKFKIEKND